MKKTIPKNTKLFKTNGIEKILKACGGGGYVIYRGTKRRNIADFLSEKNVSKKTVRHLDL